MGNPVQLGHLSITPPKPYVKPRIKADRPAYLVSGKGFFDGHELWNAGSSLYFDDEPNIDMIPLNKLAHDRLQEFLDKIELLEERKCKKEGKAFVKKPREEWREDGYDDVEIKLPESLMGVRTDKRNEAIR